MQIYNQKISRLKKQFFAIIGLIGLSFILISWGSTGHNKINTASGLSFNSKMTQFNSWISVLASHASDADNRKSKDPTESPKHYIDLDNYSVFLTKGKIPQTLDSVIAIYGSSFVYGNGILPWATITSFDSLENCFKRKDWDKAVLFAADLGHYVADGHMPLHITRNYDGQYSGNTGIHSRYESTMINSYVSQINYQGVETVEIQDVRQYIFKYLYTNYSFVNSVLAGDNYAKSVNSNTSSTAYKQALWDQTKSFTIPLFSNASHALSELIYTAWVNAGSPLILTSSVNDLDVESTISLEQIAPNPISNSALIKYNLTQKSDVLLQVYNSSGQLIITLANESKEKGSYSVEWGSLNISTGIYFVMLKSGQFTDYKKVVVVK